MAELIAVTGATGDVGGQLVEHLVAMDVPVRVVVRRPAAAGRFEAMGLQTRIAALGDAGAMQRALVGADRLFLLTPGGKDQAKAGAVGVDSAIRAGLTSVTHLSTGDARVGSPLAWADAPARTDDRLRQSGLDWTILRPSAFMSNLFGSAPAIRRGFYPQTTKDGRLGWVDTADIAAVAARVLTTDVYRGQELVLTGPQALTSAQVAAAFADVLGHRVRPVELPGRVYETMLRAGRVDAWTARNLRIQFADIVRNSLDGADACTDTVEQVLGRPATSLSTWIGANVERFR